MEQDQKATMSVPEAGRRYFGLARNAAYAAAARGEFPTIRIGGRIFVKVAALEKMLAEGDMDHAARTPPRAPAHSVTRPAKDVAL